MAAPLRIDELTALGSLSSGAAVAVVQGGLTLQVPASAFITQAPSFTQSGTGAVAEDMQSRGRWVVYATDYMTTAQRANVLAGGLSPSVDVTAAVQAAIDAAETSNRRTVVFPAGSYLISSTITIPTVSTLIFSGISRTVFVFSPAAADTLFEVSNGAGVNNNTSFLGGFRCYSADTTYVKIALDLVDVSAFHLDGLLVDGAFDTGTATTWHDTTNGSIAIRVRGREASGLRNLKLVADKPITVAANPNTSATDGEDMDHFHWENCYLLPYNNYAIAVAAGLGIMECTWDGYQAWVGGTGGFFINDTRAAPNVVSRGINFSNVRTEGITDSAGYAFNMTFTSAVQHVGIENVTMATGSNGINIDNFFRCVLDRVTAAMSSTQLLVANVAATSVLSIRGCIWQSGGTFTTTGLTLISAPAYRSASYAAPSDAVYAGQIVDTEFTVAKGTITGVNGSAVLVARGTTGDALQVIPAAAGSGVSLRATNNAQTDFEPMNLAFETLTAKARTGVGTTADVFALSNTAFNLATAKLYPPKDDATSQSAAAIYAGSGVPTDANGANGDFYFRSDGTVAGNTVIYHRQAGAWVALTTT